MKKRHLLKKQRCYIKYSSHEIKPFFYILHFKKYIIKHDIYGVCRIYVYKKNFMK